MTTSPQNSSGSSWNGQKLQASFSNAASGAASFAKNALTWVASKAMDGVGWAWRNPKHAAAMVYLLYNIGHTNHDVGQYPAEEQTWGTWAGEFVVNAGEDVWWVGSNAVGLAWDAVSVVGNNVYDAVSDEPEQTPPRNSPSPSSP